MEKICNLGLGLFVILPNSFLPKKRRSGIVEDSDINLSTRIKMDAFTSLEDSACLKGGLIVFSMFIGSICILRIFQTRSFKVIKFLIGEI